MTDFDAASDGGQNSAGDVDDIKDRIWEFLVYLFRRLVVFVSFGPGILGVLWLVGRILRR
ncbi:MAG: hypothetical protein HY711_04055 [Candidatus Melainabacteria bacterium]|nr:hypothetical protein [Candidatus Melainabacteria bacterium]